MSIKSTLKKLFTSKEESKEGTQFLPDQFKDHITFHETDEDLKEKTMALVQTRPYSGSWTDDLVEQEEIARQDREQRQASIEESSKRYRKAKFGEQFNLSDDIWKITSRIKANYPGTALAEKADDLYQTFRHSHTPDKNGTVTACLSRPNNTFLVGDEEELENSQQIPIKGAIKELKE